MLMSIIIPAFNVERFIVKTILSIVENQVPLSDYEIIVINDGSTDNTLLRIQEVVKEYPLYHIVCIDQPNKGVSEARNRGLDCAKGDYVWFVDGDDLIHKNTLYFIFEELSKFVDIDVFRIADCASDLLEEENDDVLSDDCSSFEPSATEYIQPCKLLSSKYRHGHTTFIWRRSFLKENGLYYPKNLKVNEDFQFLFKGLLLANKAIVNFSYTFYFARERLDSVSRKEMNIHKYKTSLFCKTTNLLMFKEFMDTYLMSDKEKRQYANSFIRAYLKYTLIYLFIYPYPFSVKKEYLSILKKNDIFLLRDRKSFDEYLLCYIFLYRFGNIFYSVKKNIVDKL